jgi:hypothetical protein
MYTVIRKPLNKNEIINLVRENGYFTAVVAVDLREAISQDLLGFDNLLKNKLVGEEEILIDISYQVVGFENFNVLHVLVTSNACEIIGIPFTFGAMDF